MKPTIYTCCQAIPKDIYDCDEDQITKQAEEFLKHQVVNAIMTALGNEEQVVTLHPVIIEENGNYEVVIRQYIHMTPLIRCKDCKNDNNCNIQYYAQTGGNFFCGAAERRADE